MSGNDPFSAWTSLWTDAAAKAMQSCAPPAGSTDSPELFRKTRAEMMQFWSDMCEQWLRSSAMLDAQKQMLDGNLAVRKQFRETMRKMQQELHLAGRDDIDAIVAAIRRSERRVLERLEEQTSLLQDLDAKINRLSKRVRSGGKRRPAEGSGSNTSSNGAAKRRKSVEKE